MCYSAMVEQDFRKLARYTKARPDLPAFEQLFAERMENDALKIPRALEANFNAPATSEEQRIHELIREYRTQRAKKLEAELFKQKKRLADAERSLKVKETKAALESQRIAGNKIEWHLQKLAELRRTDPKPADSRIFPFHYAPVIVRVESENLIRPMRYHCRPAGKPAHYDRNYDGLYNARRDNLEGFWRALYGHSHAVLVMTGFYENVARHDFEHRELRQGEQPENLVLNFNPQPPVDMYVACLWSRWEGPGQPPLESFAAITDEPPSEVAATGHDRCVVPLQPENVQAWLTPEGQSREQLIQLLDDRARPIYEHRLAA